MNFAEWTKQQQKKNGGSQTGTSRPTTTASTISFSDWTKQKHGVQAERPVAAPKTEVPSVADKYTAPATSKVDNSKRIGELETKIGSVEKDIGNLRVGASRARAYGGAEAIEKQLSVKQKELADLQAELFNLRDAAAETAREKAEVRQERAEVEAKKTGNAVPVGEAAGRSAAAKMLNDPKAQKEFSDNIEKHNAAKQELAAANRVVGMYDYVDKYEDKAYRDNFWGQTGANYTMGRMTQDSSLAWSEYLNNPTEENRKYAESIDALLEKFMENNEDTLADDGTLRLISQSGANYLPQLIDQTKYSAVGGVAGALGGSFIPGVGTAAGLKAGIVAGSGVYSYNTMRGAAFKTLIGLGVDEETARAAANDEAVISSLIEMGDTAIDLVTLGASKLLTAAGKQGLKGLGAVLTKWAGESAAKKFGLALGKYGLNIFSEGIEEGLQQSVSLANQQRVVDGEGGGVGDLIGRSASVLWDAAMGKNADAAAEILGASKEGMKIAALMVGADAAVSGTATAINKRLSAKQDTGTKAEEQAGTAPAASKEPTAPNAGETAVKPEADPAVAEQQAAAATVETAEKQTAQEAWNQAAARAFGETGAKAFQTVNDGSIDSEALYAGFAVYHHAGMTGRDMNTITSQYAKNLPEDLRKIAYDAGVQDAAASLKARTEAAATATVYGKDAGVIANDYSKSMDQDVVRTLDRVAKSLGRKVVVEDLGDSNGFVDSNGVLHIDIHAENPHLVVAAHEVSHVMEDMAPAQHKRYRDYVLNKMADVNGGSILELVEAQKAAYAGKQILSDEQAMNELVADYTARMMKDRNLFAEFAQKDRTAAQKLLDAVKKFLQKVKAVFSGNRQAQSEAAQREFGMDISMVEEAAKLWQEALTASQAQAQTANKNTDQKAGVEVRYSKKVSSLTEADVRDLLEACVNGEFPDGSYIPIRRNTPAILLEKVQEHSNGKVMAENLPIIMNVGKVRQAMDEEDGASYGSNRPHGISDDGMIELIKKMDDPAYIVYQVDNGRYSEVVRYRDKKTGKETLTVMDFGDNKKASYMNGYEGGTYNVLVTTYNPDSLRSYLAKNEVIYDKKKDAPQRGSGSILPSHLNGSPFTDMVTQGAGKSNTKSTIKGGSVLDDVVDSEGNRLSEDQWEYFKNSKVRDENGQLLVMYHGTPNGGFTQFRSGTYFTQDPAYADVYQSPGASSISVKRRADNPQIYQVYLNIQKPFDTRNPKERKIFMDEYYRKYGTGTPLSDSGLPDWTDGMDLQEFIEEMEYDYDGLILDEGGTGGYGDEVRSRGLSYVVFSSEQVKNVSNLNPTSDPDIRYSRKGGSVVDDAAARAEDVDALKRQVEYWKSQVKQTKGFKVNTKDVEKLAKQLMRTYKVDTDTNVLTQKLQDLYDGIATGYYGNKEIDYETAQARSEEIAKIIVEDAVETENEMYVEYAELRKYLRSTTLNISAEDSHDIPDFNDFRKRNMGRMRIGTKGTNIDTVYKEMATLWPEFFNEENETTPSDQLLRIAEVMEGVYRTQAVNPFGRYAEEAVSDIADEVLAYFFTLPQAQTFADKAAARLKQSTADARLAGQMSQGRQDAKQLRQANDQIDRLKVQLKQAKADAAKLKQTGTRDASKLQKANEKVSELEAKLKQATADATLAGQMAQGRRDAALLRRSEELAARAQQRAADALAKEKQRGAEAMQKLKDTQAAKTAKTREQRKAAELRGKIIRHSRDMSQKLLRPTDKKHVPEELQSAVAAVLQAINLESNYETEFGTDAKFHRVKVGESPYSEATNRTKAFQQLREAYKKLAGEVVIDPAVISGDGDQAAAGPLLQAVLDMGDIRIADMNSSQLDTVWRVLKAVEQSVRKANKLFLSAKYETISEMASQLQSDSVFRKPKKAVKAPKFLGGSGNLTLDLEIPLTFFSQYGEVGAAMYKELRDAQDYQERLIDQLADQVGKIVTPKQVQEMQKEVHTFKTEDGDDLKLTTAHIMELYELSKRKQAEDHLLKGGIVQPEIQSAKVDRGTDMIKLTVTDIGEIISKLNKEQKQIADALQGLLTTTLADAGNRASMQAYGYKKFTGTDYWPIKSAQEALHHKVEKGANNTRSIKNIGLAQQVVPHANTALNLSGIFQTFAGHATDMIDYAAWLCPMEDANRLFNYKYKDTNGIPTGKTVKGILDKVGGSGSQAYWSNLMEDIQNGIGGPGDSAFAGIAARITGNVKGASVGANIRVVVQQPTAIFRAAAILSPANLSKGMAKGVTKGNGWKKALEHSDIAKRKERGGFEISNQMQMSEILFDDRTQLARFNDKMTWAAAKADAITWGKIWNACEWQVHGQNKALKPGSEEFYRQTAELFADVINESQVVDGVLQRSQIMRSSNQLSKQMTSFMGEPTMSLNMLMRAYDAVRYEQDPAKRSKARKQAARVAAALLVADIMTALAQSLVDGLRDDDREKKYWERVLSAFTGITGDEESSWDKAVGAVLSGNLGSTMNPVGRLPYAKDLLSLIQGYSVERMDISAFSDLISAGTTFIDSLSGEGTKTWAYATKQLATAGSKVLGISASNILRDVWSIARSIAIETGNLQLQYEMEKAIYKISNDKNDSRYIGILYDAMKNDREAYEMIYADMVKNGVAEDKIAQGIEKRMKADQGVTKVEDLTSRYLTPNQEKEYDKAYSRVTGTQVWKSATEEQREKLEGNLYDLTVGNGAGEDLREKIEPGRGVGIDEVEYLLYKLAQEVVSEDGNKNTSQAEAEAAAELLTGLSKDEQAWLWQSTNKSWKSKNNPFN